MSRESLKRVRARQKWMNDQLSGERFGPGYVTRRLRYAELRIKWDRQQAENRTRVSHD